jgi:hypothetical protein
VQASGTGEAAGRGEQEEGFMKKTIKFGCVDI